MKTVGHLFCGLGGGGLGFHRAGFRGAFAVDSSPAACRDYERIVGELVRHYVSTVLCATVLGRGRVDRPSFELSAGHDAGLVSVRMLNVGQQLSSAALRRIAAGIVMIEVAPRNGQVTQCERILPV